MDIATYIFPHGIPIDLSYDILNTFCYDFSLHVYISCFLLVIYLESVYCRKYKSFQIVGFEMSSLKLSEMNDNLKLRTHFCALIPSIAWIILSFNSSSNRFFCDLVLHEKGNVMGKNLITKLSINPIFLWCQNLCLILLNK